MSQECTVFYKTDYCPLLEKRVMTVNDNVCSGCVKRRGVKGKMDTVRGIVVSCTNGNGEIVGKKGNIQVLNNLEGMARSERVNYFMNLAKLASQWINSGKLE